MTPVFRCVSLAPSPIRHVEFVDCEGALARIPMRINLTLYLHCFFRVMRNPSWGDLWGGPDPSNVSY